MRRCKAKLFFLVCFKSRSHFYETSGLYTDSGYSEDTYLQDHFKENVNAILFGVKNSVMFRRGIARMKQITIR